MLLYAPTLKNYALWALMLTTAGWLTLTFGLVMTAEIIMAPIMGAIAVWLFGRAILQLMNAPFMRKLEPKPKQGPDFSKVSSNSHRAMMKPDLTPEQRALVAYDPKGVNLYEMVKEILEANPQQFSGMRLQKPGEWFGIEVHICDDASVNAFAFGLTKNTSMIVVHTELLRLLTKQDGSIDRRAVKAVLAHELGHIKHRHCLQHVLMNILDEIIYMGQLLRKPAPLLGQLLGLFAYAELLFASFSRQCEYMADATAVKCGYKSDLKRALVKMHIGQNLTVGNTNTQGFGWIVRITRGFLTLIGEHFSTHPFVKNRLLAIKAEYERYDAERKGTLDNRGVVERLKSEAKDLIIFEAKSIVSHFTSDAVALRAPMNDVLSKADRKKRLS